MIKITGTIFLLCLGLMLFVTPGNTEDIQKVRPEPFPSRWAPELPTGYPEFMESEKQVLREKGQEVLQQIRNASGAGKTQYVITPGDYLFHANWSRASTLKDIGNLEIVADGVTFWFEPEMVHGLLFENCHNITVRGLTIDFTIPCWFQSQVTEIDRQKKTIQATLMEGYPPLDVKGEPETIGERVFMFYDASGTFINHRHVPGQWQLLEDGNTVSCVPGRHGIPDGLQPGDYMVGTIRTGAALRVINCADMRFEDINIWSSPGMAVHELGGEGGNVYHRVRATRRPGTNRLQAFGADVFHLAGTDRGPTLDRCEAAYGADDTLNVHGNFGRIVQCVDHETYYMQGAYEVGDALEFRDQNTIGLLGTVKVIDAEKTPDGPTLAINEKYNAKSDFLVTLDKTLELPDLSLVVMDGKQSAEGFIVRNCWFHDDFQRTLINGSPGGTIENNTFQNVGYGICVQFETWGPWMEGPFASNLKICNNRFLDILPASPVIAVSMHPAGGGSDRRRFEARPVKNLMITGNYFSNAETPLISIHNVDQVRIEGNHIDWKSSDISEESSDWLYLQDCANVSVEENKALGYK